jgi:hypothetical protein
MAVEIVEAYDQPEEAPGFYLVYDETPWRCLRTWWFQLVQEFPSGRKDSRAWAVCPPLGASYEHARQYVERRAEETGLCRVTLYDYQRPPTREKIACIEAYNRELARERQEKERESRAQRQPDLGRPGQTNWRSVGLGSLRRQEPRKLPAGLHGL